MQASESTPPIKPSPKDTVCVSQQVCPLINQQALQLQVFLRQNKDDFPIAMRRQTVSAVLKMEEIWEDYSIKVMCDRCHILKGRIYIDAIHTYLRYLFQSTNLSLPFSESDQQAVDDVICRHTSLESVLTQLQGMRRVLIQQTLYCERGQFTCEEVYRLAEEETWPSDDWELWTQTVVEQQSYIDPDPRPPVEPQQCSIPQHSPSIIEQLSFLSQLCKQAPLSLSQWDVDNLTEQVTTVKGLWDEVERSPKCKDCRSIWKNRLREKITIQVKKLRSQIIQQIDSEKFVLRQDAHQVPFGIRFDLDYLFMVSEAHPQKKEKQQSKFVPEPKKIPQVSFNYCATRRQGLVILKIVEGFQNWRKNNLGEERAGQLGVLVQKQFATMMPLWQEYVKMPKCEQCLTTRSRLERQMARQQLQTWMKQTFNVRVCFRFRILSLGRYMRRVVRWCQQENYKTYEH